MRRTIARLISTYVSGFKSDDTLPARSCRPVSEAFVSSKRCICLSSSVNALITLAPDRFSLTSRSTSSSFFWTAFRSGMLDLMIRATTIARASTTRTKTTAQTGSIVNAMTTAPRTMNGDLRNSLRNMLTPFWSVLTSAVCLVIIALVPTESISKNPNERMCEKRSCLSSREKPVAALAAKNWAVHDTISPTRPSTISIAKDLTITSPDPCPIPLSIMYAITRGTISSKAASSILKRGARTHSFL